MGTVLSIVLILILVVIGLSALGSGSGPAALKPVSDALKPVGDAIKGLAGPFGFIAVVLGLFTLLGWVLSIERISFAPLNSIVQLVTAVLLIGLGAFVGHASLTGYVGEQTPAGGHVTTLKKLAEPIAMILGAVALVLAIWELLTLIIPRMGLW